MCIFSDFDLIDLIWFLINSQFKKNTFCDVIISKLCNTDNVIALVHGCIVDTMVPQWAIIGGACILPHIGGVAGGLITRSQIKTWYEGR